MTSPELICGVTWTWATGIVTSYSSIVLACANWRKGDISQWMRTMNIDFLPPCIHGLACKKCQIFAALLQGGLIWKTLSIMDNVSSVTSFSSLIYFEFPHGMLSCKLGLHHHELIEIAIATTLGDSITRIRYPHYWIFVMGVFTPQRNHKVEVCCSLCCQPGQAVQRTTEMLVIRDAMRLVWRYSHYSCSCASDARVNGHVKILQKCAIEQVSIFCENDY